MRRRCGNSCRPSIAITASRRCNARSIGCCRHRALPPQLPPGILETIPEGPSVYLFYGRNRLPLYIGKSVALRDRVRSHFSSDYRSERDQRLSSEMERIEWEETAGELGALLRESQLIKVLLPLHNHRLRRKAESVTLRLPDSGIVPEIVKA